MMGKWGEGQILNKYGGERGKTEGESNGTKRNGHLLKGGERQICCWEVGEQILKSD